MLGSNWLKLSMQEIRLLESVVVAHIEMRPVKASCHCCRARKLRDYLDLSKKFPPNILEITLTNHYNIL